MRPFELIKDFNRRILLTTDVEPVTTYKGIQKLNVIDWLRNSLPIHPIKESLGWGNIHFSIIIAFLIYDNILSAFFCSFNLFLFPFF